jgi:two-component system, OmpR family, phosphate regulon response regulator PhoB
MVLTNGEGQILKRGPIELDVERWCVRVNEREVDLSPRQFKLLHHLMKKPGRVWTRAELMDAAWGTSAADERQPQVVDVLICRIRRRLRGAATLVETVRSVGYRFSSRFGGPGAKG